MWAQVCNFSCWLLESNGRYFQIPSIRILAKQKIILWNYKFEYLNAGLQSTLPNMYRYSTWNKVLFRPQSPHDSLLLKINKDEIYFTIKINREERQLSSRKFRSGHEAMIVQNYCAIGDSTNILVQIWQTIPK